MALVGLRLLLCIAFCRWSAYAFVGLSSFSITSAGMGVLTSYTFDRGAVCVWLLLLEPGTNLATC